MRYAVSTEGDFVAQHFGRCPSFTLVDVESGNRVKEEVIPNPGHQPGFIPEFLKSKSVECIVAGGMGARAQELFDSFGIKAVLGVSGAVAEVVELIKSGQLKGGTSLCRPGSGKGHGLEKSFCDHGRENICPPGSQEV